MKVRGSISKHTSSASNARRDLAEDREANHPREESTGNLGVGNRTHLHWHPNDDPSRRETELQSRNAAIQDLRSDAESCRPCPGVAACWASCEHPRTENLLSSWPHRYLNFGPVSLYESPVEDTGTLRKQVKVETLISDIYHSAVDIPGLLLWAHA